MLDERRDKVIVLDDDPSNRKRIILELNKAGYWVLEANRYKSSDPIWPREANIESPVPDFQTLADAHFSHAAVIDLSLLENDPKDRKGFGAVEYLQDFNEATKVLILTAHAESKDVRMAWKRLGVEDFLEKVDSSPAEIKKYIDIAVRKAKLQVDRQLNVDLSFYTMLSEYSLQAVREELGCGGEQEIRTVFEEALRPYFPFDRKYKRVSFEKIKEHTVLYVQLWSRYLGAKIDVRIGASDDCEFRAIAIEAGGKRKGEDFTLYRYHPRDKVIALVEYINTTPVQDSHK